MKGEDRRNDTAARAPRGTTGDDEARKDTAARVHRGVRPAPNHGPEGCTRHQITPAMFFVAWEGANTTPVVFFVAWKGSSTTPVVFFVAPWGGALRPWG